MPMEPKILINCHHPLPEKPENIKVALLTRAKAKIRQSGRVLGYLESQRRSFKQTQTCKRTCIYRLVVFKPAEISCNLKKKNHFHCLRLHTQTHKKVAPLSLSLLAVGGIKACDFSHFTIPSSFCNLR